MRLARGLGVLSLGLGGVAVGAAGWLGRLTGVGDSDVIRNALRGVGARELGSGVGLLVTRQAVPFTWARVVGDAMDLSLLGLAAISGGRRRERIAIAAGVVAGIAALDVYSGIRFTRRSGGQGIEVTKAITVNRTPQELYTYWRDFSRLPRFMRHLEAVEVTSERTSHWTAAAPAGATVTWDAEITQDDPGRLIAWRSLPGASVDNEGQVRFASAPGNRGSEVRVEMRYSPPAGKAGAIVAKLFGEAPDQQVQDDLRHFKQIMETGEITKSAGTLPGHGPGQPPEQAPQTTPDLAVR